MNIIVTILLVSGLLFFTGGTLGILRFPDCYSRLHPAGKLDTMASVLMLGALALFTLDHFAFANLLTAVKIILIVVFVSFASPTAVHAIVDAGVRAGLAPWKKGKQRR